MGRPDPAELHGPLLAWYSEHARVLPWRHSDCTPWGILLSEVMAQQTPLVRVEPAWREWMERWPTAAHLAAASPGEAVRAWGRLGYPRRALRLHDMARVIVDRHAGEVPTTEIELLALPGVGPYTAAAVAAFAFGVRTVVVDTNVRRVLTRTLLGKEHAAPALTAAEQQLAAAAVPVDRAESTRWNVALMELGALVCKARGPRCEACPLIDSCAWVAAGRPAHDGPPRRGQGYEGTDRKVRGDLVQRLRDGRDPLHRSAFDDIDPDPQRVDRLLDALVDEGLVQPLEDDRFRLPA